MGINYREIKRTYQAYGPKIVTEHLTENLKSGQMRPEDFSFRALAESLVPDGNEWVRSLDPNNDTAYPLMEGGAGAGVDVSAFKNITGILISAGVMQGYESVDHVATRLVDTRRTKITGGKVPGVGRLSDNAEVIQPGGEYPHFGFGEEYLTLPDTVKRGFIVPVTKEAIFFDLTGLVLERAGEVGSFLGVSKEKRIMDMILGDVASQDVNRYNRNGTTSDTYQTASPWINDITTNDLVDWTDIDAVETTFAAITDPVNGEPISIGGKTVLVTPARALAAKRIFGMIQSRTGDITSGTGPQVIAGNPVPGYTVEVSPYLTSRLAAASQTANRWFCGNFKRAFWYLENWPITVSQAPSGNNADFNRDIVLQFKASEQGTPAVRDPRYVVRSTP